MCYVWEGKIEKCQQCSEYDFQRVLRAVWNIEPARSTHQFIARTAQQPLNTGHPQSSRHDARIDLHRDLTVENTRSHERDLTHQVQPSSSRHDVPINETAQHKRQNIYADQRSSSRHNARVDGAAQPGQQEKNAVQACTLRQAARTASIAQSGQHAKDQDPSCSSMHNAHSDWAWGRQRTEGRRDPPSSSRQHATTVLTSQDEHQGKSQRTCQNHPRVEDMEGLTAGMNKLPSPCWEDEQVILPLVQEQLWHDEYFESQEQRLDDIWGLYGQERQALAASHTPEPEESWTPEFQEEEILERTVPLEEEIWARSVLDGEAWMRSILDEDGSWPRGPSDEADIWTREKGGMLSAAVLRRVLRALTLQASLEEERLE